MCCSDFLLPLATGFVSCVNDPLPGRRRDRNESEDLPERLLQLISNLRRTGCESGGAYGFHSSGLLIINLSLLNILIIQKL
jgi:hypothetical protein